MVWPPASATSDHLPPITESSAATDASPAEAENSERTKSIEKAISDFFIMFVISKAITPGSNKKFQ